MSRPADLDVIVSELNSRADSIARWLLPNGRHEMGGRYWSTSNIRDEKTGTYSLKVKIETGTWADYALTRGESGSCGDMLELVAQVRYRGNKRDAIAWARSALGYDDLDPNRIAAVRAEQRARNTQADEARARKQEWMRRHARGLFLDRNALPLRDSPAEQYLASRGIDLSCIGRVTNALGFNANVKCTEVDAFLPAMIARVLDGEGQHVATHRTWIEPDPETGLWRKAGLQEPKKLIGSHLGCYIPLNKGECRETLAKIRPGVPIGASEGIEDGMTVACAVPELRLLSAVALANIAELPLPEHWIADPASQLIIIGQNDPEGSDAHKTLLKVLDRLDRRRIRVAVAKPSAAVKDVNELVSPAPLQRKVG